MVFSYEAIIRYRFSSLLLRSDRISILAYEAITGYCSLTDLLKSDTNYMLEPPQKPFYFERNRETRNRGKITGWKVCLDGDT